ncbi:MAG: S9 family peptidase [Gemmatimonadetes bacterium]|nr:S9 family peptidase [Gemmatimonadota bacterium]
MLTALLPPAPAAAQSFTLGEVMSAPFPGGLVAAPGGGAFAWVQNDRGARNVWVASAPDYRGRALTSWEGDNGQEVGSLTFTPDGAQIVFVRGGAPNRAGEIPNPTSEPEWPDRAVYRVAVAGGEPVRLAAGSGPVIAPNGEVVAYTDRGQVWTVPLAGGDAEQLLQMRGGASSLTFSPDGTQLALVSGRGDHSFVGIVDVASGAVQWIDPSVDLDGEPAWSSDGRRLAFVRRPNVRDQLPFEPRRSGHPWSIRVHDVASGETRTAFEADEGPGSVFQGTASADQLLWSGDRIVFPWEKTGWINLYSVPATGGTARPLVTGAFEVEFATPTPDGSAVLVASNQDDIDRRHVWRVDVASGRSTLLTPGTGIEWEPVSDGARVAFLASGPRTPAHARILEGSGSRPLDPDALEGFPSDELVEPTQVIFSAADGMPIHAQLFLPEDLRAGERRPAVVFFHGGSRRQMLLGFHYRDYYHNAYALNQYLAAQGYVVLSVNYRSGTGYGLDFREALDYGARGASEFNDVLGAGLYLRGRADVDPDRIGLWGGSYGGYLTALGLARASDLFAAGVDIHGVHDWNVVVKGFVPSYNAEARAEWSDLAYRSSPMAFLDGWRSPVLVIHGDDDRNVPFSESVDLVESLRDRGIEAEQLIFPDEVHGFLLHRNWLAAYEATAGFFARTLRSRRVSAR